MSCIRPDPLRQTFSLDSTEPTHARNVKRAQALFSACANLSKGSTKNTHPSIKGDEFAALPAVFCSVILKPLRDVFQQFHYLKVLRAHRLALAAADAF